MDDCRIADAPISAEDKDISQLVGSEEDRRSRKESFLHSNPDYGYNGKIDDLRPIHFARLRGQVYLDNAGAALYSEPLLQKIFSEYSTSLLGNPHSQSPSSRLATQLIDQVRTRVLQFFGTTAKDYSVIFTAGCTAALKLVGEGFPWSLQSEFCYLSQCHNSVLGIREYAAHKGSTLSCVELEDVRQCCEHHSSKRLAARIECCQLSEPQPHHLFAFPAECNFSGVKFPLELIKQFRNNSPACGRRSGQWHVLVDAAAYVGHSQLNLTEYPADFVTVSFYKLFGYPTGLGALLVRNDTVRKAGGLTKPAYFGGGTVEAALSYEQFHILRKGIAERFEDGTVDFLGIIALRHGFDLLEHTFGGMEAIGRHTAALSRHIASELSQLVHPANGIPVCELYGDHLVYTKGPLEQYARHQGPIVCFNLRRSTGAYVGYNEVSTLAALHGLHIRTGCFCNPGACSKYLGLTAHDVKENNAAGHICWDDKAIMRGKPTGAVRVSLGYYSTWEDADTFLQFVKKYFVDTGRAPVPVERPTIRQPVRLAAIYIYPIKSCRGYAVTGEWPITPLGLAYDREWVVVDEHGMTLNQKRHPKLALIRPTVDIASHRLVVDAPGMETLVVGSLDHYPADEIDISVLGDPTTGRLYPDEVCRWFSDFLGKHCALVRVPPRAEQARKVHSTAAGLAFSNESQFLLVSRESVRELNTRMRLKGVQITVDAERFRPNLVIEGGVAWQEDTWTAVPGGRLVLGGVAFRVVGACNRCQMVCIDQDTATKSKEPLATLAEFRRREGQILFGIHLVHDQHSATPLLTIGAAVEWRQC